MARTRKTDRTEQYHRLVKMVEISHRFEMDNRQIRQTTNPPITDWELSCFLSAAIGNALILSDGDWAKAQKALTEIIHCDRFRQLLRRRA